MTTENKSTETVETDRVSNATPNDGLNTPETDEVSKETPIEQEQGKGNKEAAKYRRQLRETEEVRDQLHNQVNDLRQAIATFHAQKDLMIDAGAYTTRGGERTPILEPAQLHNPEDLFTIGGLEIDNLFTDEGNFSEEKLQEAATELYKQRPELFKTKRRLHVPAEGRTPRHDGQADTWKEAFTRKDD